MPDLSSWLYNNETINAEERAVDAWNRINRNPTEITVSRKDSANIVQTVRIEFDNTATESTGKSSSITSARPLTIFGVIGHPDASVIDTDLERGDIFDLNGQGYRVVDVLTLRGEIQARAEGTS